MILTINNPYLSLLQTAWKYARQEKPKFLLVYSLFGGANLVSSLNPLIYGWYINELQKHGVDVLKKTWVYALAYFALSMGEWIFHGPARIWERELAFNLSRNFLQEKYHQILHLPVKWHQDNHSGATINRLRKSYEALKGFFQNGFQMLHTFFKFIFSIGAMIYFSPLFGFIGILIGLITIRIIFLFDQPLIKAQNDANEKEHTVSATLFDSLSNIITVITLRLEKQMESSILYRVKDIFSPFMKSVRVNEWKWFTVSAFVALIYGMVTVGFVYQHWQPGQVFMVGGLVTLLGYVNNFSSVFHDVAWQYTQVVQFNTDVKAIREIENAFHDHHRIDSEKTELTNWKKIEINNLNFTHNESYNSINKSHSLHHVDFKFIRGQRIALIGESGSGKSTLLALLRGLYEAEKGILVKINNSTSHDLSIISSTVTLFPQEPEIFENTIEYNISLGIPIPAEEIRRAAELAHFADVINQLPKGLQSNIQEKGVNLSGGQKQRLALARGILAAQESSIVLMDEPTSSVDPKTESLIYDKLFTEFKDKTIISSLHRLHLLSKFDYVYILKEGKIVDEGSFLKLKNESEVFHDLWKHQKEIEIMN